MMARSEHPPHLAGSAPPSHESMSRPEPGPASNRGAPHRVPASIAGGLAGVAALAVALTWWGGGAPGESAPPDTACVLPGPSGVPATPPGAPPFLITALGHYADEDVDRPRLGSVGPNGGPTAHGFRFWARGVGQPDYFLRGVTELAVDATGRRLFVPDSHNHRVLVFDLGPDGGIGPREASLVLGQPDAGTTWSDDEARPDMPPHPAAATDRLLRPTAVAYDDANRWLFVADTGWDRIRVFDLAGEVSDGMSAAAVLDGSAVGGLTGPEGLAFDAVHRTLWVSDTGADRLVRYDLPSGLDDARAEVVPIDPSVGGLDAPRGVTVAPSGRILYVADSGRHRVLVLDVGASPATVAGLIGQGSLEEAAPNRGRVRSAPDAFRDPHALVVDEGGRRLWVSDARNHRVVAVDLDAGGLPEDGSARLALGVPALRMPVPDGLPPATRVSMNYPTGLARAGRWLYVADRQNNRVLVFDAERAWTGRRATDVLGQYHEGRLERPSFAQQGPNDGPTSYELNQSDGVSGVAVGSQPARLAVADALNGRVLIFDLDASGLPADVCADQVLGAPDFATVGGQAITRSTIRRPQRLTFSADGRRLFVADDQASRVLVFRLDGGRRAGVPAATVLGQPDFRSSEPDAAGGLDRPRGVAYADSAGWLFVSDTNNHRIVVYDIAGDAATAPVRVAVVERAAGSTLSFPRDVVFDAVSRRLFVADVGNRRIVSFKLAPGLVGLDGADARSTDVILPPEGSEPDGLGGLALDGDRRRLWAVGARGRWIAGWSLDPSGRALPDPVVTRFVTGTGLRPPTFGGAVAVEPRSGRLYLTDGTNTDHRILLIDPR